MFQPHSEDAEVMCYSLVHWEDPSSSTASCEWDREGPVCYKSAETTTILGTQTWRLAHAVLKYEHTAEIFAPFKVI